MTVIGAILTSLVVAREWERAPWRLCSLRRLPARNCYCVTDPLLFSRDAGDAAVYAGVSFILGVPYRGSLLILFFISSLFYSVPWGWGC